MLLFSLSLSLSLLLTACRTDSEDELSLLQRLCKDNGAFDAVVCSHWVFFYYLVDIQ